MLAPKSARALLKQPLLIKQGKVKLPGSFSFLGIELLICEASGVRFCVVDTAYWEDPILRIGYESTSIIVEIDLTWSLGLVSVKLGKLPNPLSYRTFLIFLIWISKVLIDAPWFLMAASVEARIYLIKLELSSCLFADSLINFLRVSSIDCLRSWYEGFALFL
ncbi:hypothetical protein Tco_0575218 [Tanacetum coccineum]